MNLIFFDNQADKIAAYQTAFSDFSGSVKIRFLTGDVRELVRNEDIKVVVSPANCLGFMDGGIDIFYMQMFPGIQLRVQKRIESFGITTALGRHILPIGSAMFVLTGDDKCKVLACVPTMFLPEDIRGTRNVYWAMRGLLKLLTSSQLTGAIGIPCMGTGVGKLSAADSAEQVREAFNDHYADTSAPPDIESHAYVLPKAACLQPITYANTEIQPETMDQIINR